MGWATEYMQMKTAAFQRVPVSRIADRVREEVPAWMTTHVTPMQGPVALSGREQHLLASDPVRLLRQVEERRPRSFRPVSNSPSRQIQVASPAKQLALDGELRRRGYLDPGATAFP